MLSTQLRPAAEAQSFREVVLAALDRPVSFVPLDGDPDSGARPDDPGSGPAAGDQGADQGRPGPGEPVA